jgi:hypothetical protein
MTDSSNSNHQDTLLCRSNHLVKAKNIYSKNCFHYVEYLVK